MKLTMVKRLIELWYLICSIVIAAEFAQGQDVSESRTDSLIQAGIEFSIQHNYYQAESIFQQLIKNNPAKPIGYFFMAATIQSKMMDYESDRWSQDFYRYIHLAIYHAKNSRFEQDENDPWNQFYYGSALCYLAFFEGKNGNYFKAFNHGLSGISTLKKVIERHPEFYDAYFGIGSYNYWRSQKTKYFNWLPLISDKRQEGIERIQQAVEQGRYTRYPAINELIWILLDSERAEEAYSWALKGLEIFPQSRFFLWGAAKSAFAAEDYSNAFIHFKELLKLIVNSPFDNYYNEFICRVKLARCYNKLGKYDESYYQLEILQSLPISNKTKNKLKKSKKELSELEKSLAIIASSKSSADSLITKNNFANEQSSQ